MGFKPYDICHGQNHGIVSANDYILWKRVCFGIANNVVEGCFHFIFTKNSFSIFGVIGIFFFV
jgi:hypothetical protein